MSTAVADAPILIATVLLVIAAMLDIAFRQVPNWLPAALAVDGLGLRLLSSELLIGAAAGASVFIVCALLWRRGLLGGGDVKLLGAAATVVPFHFVLSLILSVTLAGGVLALAYLAMRSIMPRPSPVRPSALLARIARVERRRIRQCRSLPYACAIATGAFITLAGG